MLHIKASGNGYPSHFADISETLKAQGEDLTLKEFLEHFGIMDGRPLYKVENRIRAILDSFGIKVIEDNRYEQNVRNRIVEEKPAEYSTTMSKIRGRASWMRSLPFDATH